VFVSEHSLKFCGSFVDLRYLSAICDRNSFEIYDVRCAIATQNKMTGFMVESGHFYPALHGLGYACSRELLYDGAGVAVEIIAT
jgi:hypothetical protein